MLTMQQFHTQAAARREIISGNASRRMRGLAALPVPSRPERPRAVQIETADGGYVGTWPVGTSKANAIDEARDLGYGGKLRVRMVEALR